MRALLLLFWQETDIMTENKRQILPEKGEVIMAKYTKEEILQIAEEENVEFIRLQFTDVFGNLKNLAITAGQLEKALNND